MRAARAVRQLSRLGWGARQNVSRGLGCVWNEQRRGFWAIRLIRGVHDVVGHAISLGEYATGVRPPQAERSSLASHNTTLDKNCQNISHNPHSWHTSPPIPPTADPTTPADLPEQTRSVMRLLPHSVVVCTSTHGETPRAMTMSSFTSLTLSPTPLISFNIATPSRTLDAIAASRHFNIHVMSGDELGVEVADRFTKGNTDDVFDGIKYDANRTDAGGAPLIQEEGVMYALRCRLLPDEPTRGLVRVRDHVIVVGEVVELISGSHANKFGLSYADRKYRQVGRVISQE
ncbi:flavin reductase like domain-containing protein [Trichoderma austrokoningii]